MVLPELIRALKQQHALQPAEVVGTHLDLLGLIQHRGVSDDAPTDLIHSMVAELILGLGPLSAEDALEAGPNAGDIPVLGMGTRVDELVHHVVSELLDGLDDHRPDVFSHQCLSTHHVDGLALEVHHIVVLKQLLADVEVVALDLFLRVLDGAVDPAVLDGLVIFEAHLLHPADDLVGAEDAEEVIFEAEVEATGAGISLTTRATAKLVVDAAGLVTLGPEDVQPPCSENLGLLIGTLHRQLLEEGVEFLWLADRIELQL